MNKTRLQISRRDIMRTFDSLRGRVLGRADIAAVLAEQREGWRLARRTTVDEFIDFLKNDGNLREHILRAPAYESKTVKRYSWGEISPLLLGLSLHRDAYFTHGTATWLHGLTDLVPRQFFVNIEQSPKPRGEGRLTQVAVDTAFARASRRSNLIYEIDDASFVVLNGKSTGRLAVETNRGPAGESLAVTNLERTLIDIVVRSAYAGGATEVLSCYRRAREGVSTNKLVAILTKLDYVYPYHQSIGFMMERAGFDESRLGRLRRMPQPVDFYLEHGIKEPAYSSRWRLYYPKALDLLDQGHNAVKIDIE